VYLFYPFLFLVLFAAAVFHPRKSPKRRRLNGAGLLVISAYLAFSFAAKATADKAFEQSMAAQGIRYSSYISKPTPLNTLLWTVTAKGEDGYYTGFYSILDNNQRIKYDFEPSRHELVAPYRGHPKTDRLLEITKGYFTVEKADTGIYINDLRFGQFDGWRKQGGTYVFVYHVWQDKAGQPQFKEINYRPKPDKAYLSAYLNRILGQK